LAYIQAVVFICLGSFVYHRVFVKGPKDEVAKVPKVPMLDCPKHGIYPESAAIDISAVAMDNSRPDLPVKICPFCLDDNMTIADKQLTALEKARDQSIRS